MEETDEVRVEKHVQVHEDIVAGPHGTQTVVLTIDEDVHIEEEINKTEVESSMINGGAASVFNHHHDHHRKE